MRARRIILLRVLTAFISVSFAEDAFFITEPNSTSVWHWPPPPFNNTDTFPAANGTCSETQWEINGETCFGDTNWWVGLYDASGLVQYQYMEGSDWPTPNPDHNFLSFTVPFQIPYALPAKSTGWYVTIVPYSQLSNGTPVYDGTIIFGSSQKFTIVNSSALASTSATAAVSSTPSTTRLSTSSATKTPPTSSGLSNGAKAGIGVGVALGFLITAASLWFLCICKWKHEKHILRHPDSSSVVRHKSTTYRKPELEGDHGKNSFHYPGKPELDVTKSITGATISNVVFEGTATQMPSTTTHEATEKEVVDPDQPISHAKSPEHIVQLPVPQTENAAPKYLVTDNLDNMRAQERQLASEIEAHEALHRLRGEHAALLQRIKEAEAKARSP